jgi:c-di-GMP-binding flagellar brake protein YcgR
LSTGYWYLELAKGQGRDAMSGAPTVERRQMPRVALEQPGIECRLELRTRVRLLDISLSGALLAAELALPTGVPARLRSSLGSSTFHSDVEVRRDVSLAPGVPLHGLGAAFTTMDERSRRSLEDFLRKASQ